MPDAFGNALGNSIVGAIQQGREDRKVEDALKKAGINPDDANDPRRSQALLDTTRGLLQRGYTPDQIAQLIGTESIQQQLGRIDGTNATISSYSEDDVARLRGEKPSPMSSQIPTYDSDGVMGITVYDDPTIAAGSGFAENVLRPVMDAAAAFGDFAAQHETLALMAGTATQIALQGPAAFVKNTIVDMVVGRTVGEYSRQMGDYIHNQAAGFIEKTWGFDADESSFLAHGVAFAGQVVLDSAKNIVGSAKSISNMVRDEKLPSPLRKIPATSEKRIIKPDPNGGVQYGIEYKWVDDNGQTVRFRAHGPDGTAPAGSNAAIGPTYRVQVGNRYMDVNGNLYPRNVHNSNSPHYDPAAANATHIPFTWD